MVADDRARAFHDPTLLWWDETAQILRRAQALRSTNPMARQLRALYEGTSEAHRHAPTFSGIGPLL